jgi:hypothetical protein
MNTKTTIAGATFIITAALATGAIAQKLAHDALVPRPATVLAPDDADPWSADPAQAMSAGPAEFEDQAFTEDDSPQIIGMDPGSYVVPAWGADADTSIRLL